MFIKSVLQYSLLKICFLAVLIGNNGMRDEREATPNAVKEKNFIAFLSLNLPLHPHVSSIIFLITMIELVLKTDNSNSALCDGAPETIDVFLCLLPLLAARFRISSSGSSGWCGLGHRGAKACLGSCHLRKKEKYMNLNNIEK